MASQFVSIVAVLVSTICIFSDSAVAGSIAAWNPTPLAPQIIMQEDVSGKILHSLCNSQGSPIFPNNDSAALDIFAEYTPKNGTSLAGVGWYAKGGSQAAIQFQTKRGKIAHTLWECTDKGKFRSTGQFAISDVAPSVHPQTGLSTVVLGAKEGYRVYYQDANNKTCALRYWVETESWTYEGYISQDLSPGVPLSAGWNDIERINVAWPRGSRNIEVSQRQENGSWSITTFPTPLDGVVKAANGTNDTDSTASEIIPTTNSTTLQNFELSTNNASTTWKLDAWDGKAESISYLIDSTGTPSIFYVGNDAKLHQVHQVNGSWAAAPDQQQDIWPVADNNNSAFGATYDHSEGEAWLYYMSKGEMVQVYRSADATWESSLVLEKFNSTEPTDTSGGIITGGAGGGLSGAAKVGIGIGIGLGCVAIIGFGILFIVMRRRKARADREAEAEAAKSTAAGSPVSFHSQVAHAPAPVPAPTVSPIGSRSNTTWSGHWVDGQWVPSPIQGDSEYAASAGSPGLADTNKYLQPQPVFEMANPVYSHEMVGEGHQQELPDRAHK